MEDDGEKTIDQVGARVMLDDVATKVMTVHAEVSNRRYDDDSSVRTSASLFSPHRTDRFGIWRIR